MRISPGSRVAVLALLLAALGFLVPATPARAQESKSAAAAKELAQALQRAKLESIAARDPTDQGTFVAALFFGSQLLVVSAKYAVPPLLLDKLTRKDYRDVYIDLNSAGVAGTKVFVMDHNADGLVAIPADAEPHDTWEQANKQMAFDGEWKKAKISEAEYMKAFAAADERYAKMLALLAAQAKQGGAGSW
jgi:type II secretory pathway pseudopilin PulG